MHKAHARRGVVNGLIGPDITPERRAKGPVERLAEVIEDTQGNKVKPYKALARLEQMERAKIIDEAMKKAGLTFNRLFYHAGFTPLRAPDLTRVLGRNPHHRPRPGWRGSERAYEQVFASIDQLGGLQMPGGSCAWHCLGCEWTVEKWALSRVWNDRRVEVHAAGGILLTDLGILRNYYERVGIA